MGIYDSKIWLEDLDKTIKHVPELVEMAGKTVLITGCTGLICSAIVDLLIRWNETHEDKINILAAGRNKQSINARFAPYSQRDYFTFISYDATVLNAEFDFLCDYIIHGASNASPNRISENPVETMLSNFIGVRCLLEYAKNAKVKRLLYISSSEVYGKNESDEPSKIEDYGWIDILNPRNSYSVSKRAAETLCVSYYDEYNVDSVIARPGHIYGPTAKETDNRVSSMWAYAAARGKDIIMKSDGSQIRSYCYCLDCASAIMKVLLKGESANAYNISNPNSIISIRKMAEIFSEISNSRLRIELPNEKEKRGFNPMTNSSISCNELLQLKWIGCFDNKVGLKHTVEILKDMMGNELSR